METQGPFWLEPYPVTFPPTELALEDPNGLLAIGGGLTVEWLLHAYQKGIFPWFSPGEPILWWSPNPRSVLLPEQFKIARSLKQKIKKQPYSITLDKDFKSVLQQCANIPRPGQDGTWITDEIKQAYHQLHQSGYAHSVEAWDQAGNLVGGLYGVALGKVFYGESMFALKPDASKIAFTALVMQLQDWEFQLIDTQVETDHLNRFGAKNMLRAEFEQMLKKATAQPDPPKKWQFECDWQSRALAQINATNLKKLVAEKKLQYNGRFLKNAK